MPRLRAAPVRCAPAGAAGAGWGGQGAAAGAKKEAGGSDFWYDVGGWAIFVSLVIGMFSMAKPAAPATQ
eukprot:jgi/Tetstr1/427016/TSEL_017221.t1